MNKRLGILLALSIFVLLACQLEYLQQSAPSASPTTSRVQAILTPEQPAAPPGFIPGLLPIAPPPTPAPQTVTGTAKENLRVRASPSTNAAIVDRFNKGDTIQIVGRTAANDWLRIVLPTNPDGRGWVSAEFVSVAGSLQALPVVQPGAPNVPPVSQSPYPAPRPNPYP